MAYYVPWVLLVVVSLWAALAGFIWALSNGQFSDQQRARFLPLRDLPPAPNPDQRKPNRAIATLLSLLGTAVVMMGAAVYILLSHT